MTDFIHAADRQAAFEAIKSIQDMFNEFDEFGTTPLVKQPIELNCSVGPGGCYRWVACPDDPDTKGLDFLLLNNNDKPMQAKLTLVPIQTGAEAPPTKKDKEMSRYDCETSPVEIYNELDIHTDNTSDAEKARIYLRDRAHSIFYSKDHELKKMFGKANDETPVGMAEFMARIKAGKYILADNHKDAWRWYDYIEWRDPDIKKDDPGYREALAILLDKLTAVKDIITVKDPEKGLAAVQDFEDWSYTSKKK